MWVKNVKKLLIFFFVFVFALVFNPHISLNVVAASESYGFENSVLTHQVTLGETGGWFTTWSDASHTYVDNNHPRSGTKDYRFNGDPYGDNTFFNFTYSEDDLITKFNIPLYLDPSGTSGMFTWFFNTSSDEDIVRIFHQSSAGENAIKFFCWSDTADDYVGLTGDDINKSAWCWVNITINANDSVDYEVYDGSDGDHFWANSSAPATVVDYVSPRVVYWNIVHPGADHDNWIDDFSITTADEFTSELIGNINISVFNESSPTTALTDWSVDVLNSLGGLIYSLSNQSNPTAINISNFGTGLRYFVINRENYTSRVFYKTIEDGWYYRLNALLPPSDDALLYYLQVINELETPIYNATVEIVKIVSGITYDVSSFTTNTFGYAGVYLLPGDTYYVNVTKDGYNSINGARWDTEEVPDPDNPKIFQLTIQAVDETVYYDFATYITFTGEMYDNSSILIFYNDRLLLTDDTQVRVFESYNGTDTLVNVSNSTNIDSFSYYVEGINATRMHYADLYFNHSLNFTADQPVRIFIYPINYTSGIPHTNATNLEDALTAVFGVNPLGWGNSISVAIALILLASFGPHNAGLGVISAGLGLVIPRLAFAVDNPLLFVVIPVIIVIGVLYIVAKNPEVKL